MTDELKAAIDRHRRYMGGENGYRVYFPEFAGQNHDWTEADESEYVRRKRQDKAILALAYIDEHPVDDDAPIDEAWIESVGFLWHSTGDYLTEKWIHVPSNLSMWEFNRTGDWIINALDGAGVNPNFILTRGQLRRLASALGIELKQAT